jgi:hypothetical protein
MGQEVDRKRPVILRLAIVLAVALLGCAVSAADALTIMVPSDAVPIERHAASELQSYLGHLLGRDVVLSGARSKGQILLFTAADLPTDLRSTLAPPEAPESFVLKSVTYDGCVKTIICGRDAVGTLYGAYELVETVMVRIQGNSNVDISFYFERGSGRAIDLGKLNLDISQTPFYRNRGLHLDFIGLGTAAMLGKDREQPKDGEVWRAWTDWCARHRLNFITNWPYGKTNWWELVPDSVLPRATDFSAADLAAGIEARRRLLAYSAGRGVAPYLMNYVPGRGTKAMAKNHPELFTYSPGAHAEVARFCYKQKALWDDFTTVMAEVTHTYPEMAGFNLRRWGESYPCECDFCCGRDPELSLKLLQEMTRSAIAARPELKLLLSGNIPADYAAHFPDNVACMIKWGNDWDPSPDPGYSSVDLNAYGKKDVIIDVALPCEESFPIGMVEHTYLDAGIRKYADHRGAYPNLSGFCAGLGDSDFGFITELNYIVFARLARDPIGFDVAAFCRAYLANKFGPGPADDLLQSLDLQAAALNRFFCTEARGGFEFLSLAPYSNWARFGDLYTSYPFNGVCALDWIRKQPPDQLRHSLALLGPLLAQQTEAFQLVASVEQSVLPRSHRAYLDYRLQTEAFLCYFQSRAALLRAILAGVDGDQTRARAEMQRVVDANRRLETVLRVKPNVVSYGDQGGNIAGWELKRLLDGIEAEDARITRMIAEGS